LRPFRQNFDLRFIEELPVQRFDSASKLGARLKTGADRPESAPESKEIRSPQRDWGHWNEENKPAIDAYNQRIERDGLPLAKYRSFAKRALRP
jgi:antitoxin CcdA